MKVFTVVGTTDTGKTSTLVNVIKELGIRGYEVNSVKSVHADNFSIDEKGKDSWRHREAGAKITALRAKNETSIIFQRGFDVKELLPFFNCDYLALEGFNEAARIPKILCAENVQSIDEKFSESVFVISGKISNELQEYKGIPVVNGLSKIIELVDLIEKHAIDSKELTTL
ncbi:MAG: molybdopterin-guanine dinucleotide biosynthesis protein B [Candidatus Heimdallarchaeota archaeon]